MIDRMLSSYVCVAIMLCPTTAIVFAQEPDTFFTPDHRSAERTIEQTVGTTSDPKRLSEEDELIRRRRHELMQDFNEPTSLDHGASIHPRLMHGVKDNTKGVRFEEREAYLRVLRLASEVPLHRLEQIAADMKAERHTENPIYRHRKLEDFPQFVDLFMHSDFYRGRPVTIQGVIRKLTKFDLGKNGVGLDQAYEGWVYPKDSQGNPLVVVFTSKDERLPVHGNLQEEVYFTGYYFKMYGYDAYDTERKAPLILAGEVNWRPRHRGPSYGPIGIFWYGAAAFAFAIGCYMVWQTNRREMPPRPPLGIEPDFTHTPPREHPATDRSLPHAIAETEDS
jgi:hypothetical protein